MASSRHTLIVKQQMDKTVAQDSGPRERKFRHKMQVWKYWCEIFIVFSRVRSFWCNCMMMNACAWDSFSVQSFYVFESGNATPEVIVT
jgi:hypothetical protein